MRSIQSLKGAAMFGFTTLSLASYGANEADTFMNGQSYYGQPTSQASVRISADRGRC